MSTVCAFDVATDSLAHFEVDITRNLIAISVDGHEVQVGTRQAAMLAGALMGAAENVAVHGRHVGAGEVSLSTLRSDFEAARQPLIKRALDALYAPVAEHIQRWNFHPLPDMKWKEQ